MNLHLNYVQWKDAETAGTEQSNESYRALSRLVILYGSRDPGDSVVLVAQKPFTSLGELKFLFKADQEVFCCLTGGDIHIETFSPSCCLTGRDIHIRPFSP